MQRCSLHSPLCALALRADVHVCRMTTCTDMTACTSDMTTMCLHAHASVTCVITCHNNIHLVMSVPHMYSRSLRRILSRPVPLLLTVRPRLVHVHICSPRRHRLLPVTVLGLSTCTYVHLEIYYIKAHVDTPSHHEIQPSPPPTFHPNHTSLPRPLSPSRLQQHPTSHAARTSTHKPSKPPSAPPELSIGSRMRIKAPLAQAALAVWRNPPCLTALLHSSPPAPCRSHPSRPHRPHARAESPA